MAKLVAPTHDRTTNPVYQAACCLWSAAGLALEEAGLRIPERGGVTHKNDGDFACEDCESLWVWWEDSVAIESSAACVKKFDRTFKILLAWNVCSERLDPCADNPGAGGCGDGTTPCPEPPTPLVGGPNDCGSKDVTTGSETSWIWLARYAIETRLSALVCECISGCGSIPLSCDAANVTSATSTVQGGCSFTEFTVTLRW